MAVATVLTRDRSSGRVHKRLRGPGVDELLSYEGCNSDQAGAYDVVDSTEGVEPADLCRRCFPDIEDSPDTTSQP